MPSESSMRKRVVKALGVLHAVPVENSVKSGTPDVNTTTGWIELKSLDKWPKRPTTTVRFPHFHEGQRHWLRSRRKVDGNAWVLVRVERDWLLFDGQWAADFLGNVTQAEMRKRAIGAWNGRLDGKDLLRCVSKNLPNLNVSSSLDDE